MIWTIADVEGFGFKLQTNHDGWCHFIGNGFDVFVNINYQPKSTRFTFHSRGNNFKGHFGVYIDDKHEMDVLLRITRKEA